MPQIFLSALRNRIKAGTALLNVRCPAWTNAILLETLDMQFSETCMLGQVFGSYDRGMSSLKLTEESAVEFGFKLHPFELSKGIQIWNTEWRHALQSLPKKRH